MDITNLIKLLDAGFTKDDILKIAGENLLAGDPKPEQESKPEQETKPEQKSKPAPDIGEKLDKLIALTLANNFGAENPFNPNAGEKAATDFFANIIAPIGGEGSAN